MKHTMKLMLTAVVLAATAGAALADGAKIAVLGGKTDDPFFAKVIKGIDDGALVAKAHGSTVNYLQLQTYDNIGGDAANLVRTAISQKATVIAVPDWVPGSEDEAGGGDKAKELGAINYVGNEEYTAGLAAGAYFGTHGSKNVICVNTVPGAQNLEDRCKGVADGAAKNGSKSTELPLPASAFGNPTAVAEAVKATLIKDKSIDGLATISAGDADSAATGIEQAGATGKVKLASFDMNDTGLARIKGGTQQFAVDQQPWLQGFLAVTLADAAVNYGLKLASAPILTGPGIVDSANIDATLAGAKAGYR
jgi:simple sugar transport system substrate-binding protein